MPTLDLLGPKQKQSLRKDTSKLSKIFKEYGLTWINIEEYKTAEKIKNFKYKFLCENNHEWIADKTCINHSKGCPYCNGHTYHTYSEVVNYFNEYNCVITTPESDYKNAKENLCEGEN